MTTERKQINWAAVSTADWRLPNSVLAARYRCTRQAVGYARARYAGGIENPTKHGGWRGGGRPRKKAVEKGGRGK